MSVKSRPGDVALASDLASEADEARLVFVGRIRSSWKTERECPKNLLEARQRSGTAWLEVDHPWRDGLIGLEAHSHLLILYWMDQARRDLVMQHPPHKADPTGTFALRSPARPNPIAAATVQLQAIDHETGIVRIDAIDCVDGTPLLDIKPWMERIDAAQSSK